MDATAITEIELRRLRVNVSYSITRCEDPEQRRQLEEFLNKELRATLGKMAALHAALQTPARPALQAPRRSSSVSD